MEGERSRHKQAACTGRGSGQLVFRDNRCQQAETAGRSRSRYQAEETAKQEAGV